MVRDAANRSMANRSVRRQIPMDAKAIAIGRSRPGILCKKYERPADDVYEPENRARIAEAILRIVLRPKR